MSCGTISANRSEARSVFFEMKSGEGASSNKFKVVRMSVDALDSHLFG